MTVQSVKPLIRWPEIASLLLAGAVGGLAAAALGLPMPYLIGSLCVSAGYTIFVANRSGRPVVFPRRLRFAFVSVIGVMIGATFSPGLLSALPALWPSLIAMVAFIVTAHASVYQLFTRLGGYDRTTALYAAMPGGLVEAVMLGERAGGDVRILTVQHFARIIIVVVTIPMLFLIWNGVAVGSAAGQVFSPEDTRVSDLALIAALALIGAPFARLAHIPAGHLMGPLILSATAHVGGLAGIHSPGWLLALAQLVIGVGLGTQFSAVTGRLLVRTFGLGLVSVALMMAVGAGFAAGLTTILPLPFEALFISYAPGGVTEMGLVALSLEISPVIVAAHHLFRITFTVFMVSWLKPG